MVKAIDFVTPKNRPNVWNRLFVKGAPLPGIIQSINVGGSLRMDTDAVAGQDGIIIGNADWSEDTASFKLLVLRDELPRMLEFRAVYKNKPGIKPTSVEVSHPLLRVMGITAMILTRLEFDWDTSLKDRIPVTVDFTNITPKPEKSNNKTVSPVNQKPGQKSGVAESDAIVGQDPVKNPTPPGLPAPARTP